MNPKHAYEIQNGKQAENNANKKQYKHKTTVTENDVKKKRRLSDAGDYFYLPKDAR